MPTMNISLPEALAAFVEQEVASGGYTTQSEVVREALRRAVMAGIDDWKAGRLDDRPINEILDDIED